MSLFNPTIPTGLVKLSLDYKNVQNNFAQLDTSFGIDHYAFSNQTASNGFHNQVTLPKIASGTHPTTSATNTIMYCMQDSTNLGLLNYSRGPSNAVPTPLTSRHSAAAGFNMNNNATVNILDATGLTLLFGTLFAMCSGTTSSATCIDVVWNNGAWAASTNSFNFNFFNTTSSGSQLKLKNVSGSNITGVFWTLKLERVQ